MISVPNRAFIEVPGKPVGKGRPRSVFKGKHAGRIYTPNETEQYEKQIAWEARAVWRGRELLTGPVSLVVTAFVPIPKEWSKKKRTKAISGALRPLTKPDWDNYGKVVSDALNGVIYADDKQVVDGRAIKFYSDRPRLEIFVEFFNQGGENDERDTRTEHDSGRAAQDVC